MTCFDVCLYLPAVFSGEYATGNYKKTATNFEKQLCTKGPKLSQSQIGGVDTVSLNCETLCFLGTRSHLFFKEINSFE